MGWFYSFDDEYNELLAHLTESWQIKPLYAVAFLNAYKKSIGKILQKGKRRSSQLRNSSDPEMRLLAVAFIDDHDFAIVCQAHRAYMTGLKRGRHIGTPVEQAIWAILADHRGVLDFLDGGLADYIDDTWEEKFPALFEEVYLEDG